MVYFPPENTVEERQLVMLFRNLSPKGKKELLKTLDIVPSDEVKYVDGD